MREQTARKKHTRGPNETIRESKRLTSKSSKSGIRGSYQCAFRTSGSYTIALSQHHVHTAANVQAIVRSFMTGRSVVVGTDGRVSVVGCGRSDGDGSLCNNTRRNAWISQLSRQLKHARFTGKTDGRGERPNGSVFREDYGKLFSSTLFDFQHRQHDRDAGGGHAVRPSHDGWRVSGRSENRKPIVVAVVSTIVHEPNEPPRTLVASDPPAFNNK